MFEMANIREHVSWIGRDREANTNKAAELVRLAVEKLRRNAPLYAKQFDVTKRVLVIGGGVAGIQAALDAADIGGGLRIDAAEFHLADGQGRSVDGVDAFFWFNAAVGGFSVEGDGQHVLSGAGF